MNPKRRLSGQFYPILLVALACLATRLFSEDSPEPKQEPFSFVQMCDTQLGMGGYEHDVRTSCS